VPGPYEERLKDGVAWRIGTAEDVAWIGNRERSGYSVTVAIPPIFESYATLEHPKSESWRPRDYEAERRQDLALLAQLTAHTERAHSERQPWWLGYLETGLTSSDVVFYDAPRLKLYADWGYVVVQAGPDQAASWRPTNGWNNWKSTELPEIMFPEDHSWLVSTLWDDDWTCIGGPQDLIAAITADESFKGRARQVSAGDDLRQFGLQAN
jgi:hypothetical protein